MAQIERGLRLRSSLRCSAAATSVLQIIAHTLGLTGLNRARVRLWFSHADRSQSIQNASALNFKFPREIVDSNFAHPSLFVIPTALAAHFSLFEVGIVPVSIIPEF
jgi:hypothetical protein